MSAPDEALIEQWTSTYSSLFLVVLNTVTYFVRPLSRREYRAALQIPNQAECEDEVVRTCLLWPTDLDFEDSPAGLLTALCAQILALSGCGPGMRERFEAGLTKMDSDLEMQMEAVIAHAFGQGGDFSQFQRWSHQQLMDAYYRAKWILENVGKLQITAQQQQAPPSKNRQKRRSLSDPLPQETVDAVMQKQMNPEAALAGANIDTRSPALMPLSEFMQLNARDERNKAIRQAAFKAATKK